VLIGSWLYLQESMHRKEATGMAFAVIGMIAYGYFASQKQQNTAKASSNGAAAPSGLAALVSTVGKDLTREADRGLASAREQLPLLVNGSSRSPASLKGRAQGSTPNLR
jgi:hypothetical protein